MIVKENRVRRIGDTRTLENLIPRKKLILMHAHEDMRLKTLYIIQRENTATFKVTSFTIMGTASAQ